MQENTKIKKHYKSKFTQIDNTLINDMQLSFQAKGVFLYLWSKPDDWYINVKSMQHECVDKQTKIYSALKELEYHGYLIRKRYYFNGKVAGINYNLSDTKEFYFNEESLNEENLNKEKSNEYYINTNKDYTKKDITNKEVTKENIKENSDHIYYDCQFVNSPKKEKKESVKKLDQAKNFDSFSEKIALDLKSIIETNLKRSIACKIESWSKDIRLLKNSLQSPKNDSEDRIKNALEKVSKFAGEKYFPIIESAGAFKEKFSKIERYNVENDINNIDMHIIDKIFSPKRRL